MKVLVLGGGGMLGHKMFQQLAARFPDTYCTLRGTRSEAGFNGVIPADLGTVLERIDAGHWPSLERLLSDLRPDVIVNCVGAIKQRAAAADALVSIALNALLPHQLASTVAGWNGRLIHFSTDCVFSGHRGSYAEDDVSDAEDLYGRTKFLGETAAPNALTIRTSIIGRELRHHASLLDWFLSQSGLSVRGYTKALWSGVTTSHLADVVGDLVVAPTPLSGLYQLSSGCVSKFELLKLLRDAYAKRIEIVPDDDVHCDRSLNGQRFAAATGYRFPGWPALLQQLTSDPTPYPDVATIAS
ncbi:MAG TPA: SDR family oxidoreductase [Gemmatimonadaceae bacterium]